MVTPTNSSSFKVLTILHLAILVGMGLFLGVAVYLWQNKLMAPVGKETERILQIAIVVIVALIIYVSFFLYKKAIVKISALNAPKEKMDKYKQASILQWAMLDAGFLLSVGGFIMTSNFAFLALAIFVLGYFLLQRPNRDKIYVHTGITREELDGL